MIVKIAHFALLVEDYDQAIQFYCEKLNFRVIEDEALALKRWVRIGLDENTSILLSKATHATQLERVGSQAGGRVFLYLHTDNIEAEVLRLKALDVKVTEEIRVEAYGKVAVIEDLYGNRIDIIEPKPKEI
jgi:predicted enzyme related to lactoylglutathione lyase